MSLSGCGSPLDFGFTLPFMSLVLSRSVPVLCVLVSRRPLRPDGLMVERRTLSTASWRLGGGDVVSVTWLTGRVTVPRNVHGSRPLTSCILPSSLSSTTNTPTSLDLRLFLWPRNLLTRVLPVVVVGARVDGRFLSRQGGSGVGRLVHGGCCGRIRGSRRRSRSPLRPPSTHPASAESDSVSDLEVPDSDSDAPSDSAPMDWEGGGCELGMSGATP